VIFEFIYGGIIFLGSLITIAITVYFKTKSFEEEYGKKVDDIRMWYNAKIMEKIEEIMTARKRVKPFHDVYPEYFVDIHYKEIQELAKTVATYERWGKELQRGKKYLRETAKYLVGVGIGGLIIFTFLGGGLEYYQISVIGGLLCGLMLLFIYVAITSYHRLMEEIDELETKLGSGEMED